MNLRKVMAALFAVWLFLLNMLPAFAATEMEKKQKERLLGSGQVAEQDVQVLWREDRSAVGRHSTSFAEVALQEDFRGFAESLGIHDDVLASLFSFHCPNDVLDAARHGDACFRLAWNRKLFVLSVDGVRAIRSGGGGGGVFAGCCFHGESVISIVHGEKQHKTVTKCKF